MSIIQYIKDIIAPKKCYCCEKEGCFFCPSCLQGIKKFEPYCHVCKEVSPNFAIHSSCQLASNLDQIIVWGKYESSYLKKLIHDGKYYGKKEIYIDLALPLAELFQKHHSIADTSTYIIVWTPMYFLRKWKRWYNHSSILAQEIGEHLWVVSHKDIIRKTRFTKQQSHLQRHQRLTNVKNVFDVRKRYRSYLKGKTVILVDDVISTGSTLGEMAWLLKLFGVKKVVWLVIASD